MTFDEKFRAALPTLLATLITAISHFTMQGHVNKLDSRLCNVERPKNKTTSVVEQLTNVVGSIETLSAPHGANGPKEPK